MTMTLEALKTKRVAVLGYGQEGQATVSYLLKHGIRPVLFDQRPRSQFSSQADQLLTENHLSFITGPHYLEHLLDYEVIFRSPGIWRLHPKIVLAEERGAVITSQTKWFFEHAKASIIGVTGTKGKGTTSSLIYNILKPHFNPLYLTGNIGKIQPLEFLDNLSNQATVIYELSSFQLQDLRISPHIAVVLMITSEHLDHHATTEEYQNAKGNITAFQTSNDVAVINDDYTASRKIGDRSPGNRLYFSRTHAVSQGSSVSEKGIMISPLSGLISESYIIDPAIISLRGRHNWENVMAASLASLAAGATIEQVQQGIKTFQSLPHRLEALPSQNRIAFFNDSIATTPETVIAAVNAFTEPILLILGGSNKHASFTELASELASSNHVKVICAIGETGPIINEALLAAGYKGKILTGHRSLRDVMIALKKEALPGDVILLSPGCASFDWFKNYGDRGNQFRDLALQWASL